MRWPTARAQDDGSEPVTGDRSAMVAAAAPTQNFICRRISRFPLRNDSLSPAQERRYKKLKDEIISEVKSLRLNQARIDALVEQLYDINKRIVGYEGRLMRLSESHSVAREDILNNYHDYELLTRGTHPVSELIATSWK